VGTRKESGEKIELRFSFAAMMVCLEGTDSCHVELIRSPKSINMLCSYNTWMGDEVLRVLCLSVSASLGLGRRVKGFER
jgi:hypothetical protein